MVPAPGQGILALEIREGDERMHDLLADLRDDEASLQAQIERQFLFYIEGGCHAPTGAYAQIDGEDIVLTGLFGTDERLVEKQARCRIGEHENVGKALALEIKRELANG